jgi:hypothetical protein
MLLFKKKFLDAIRDGQKTQTIRLWKFRRMKVGQRSYIPGVGYIGVDAVDQVELGELTDDDARLDGFADMAALQSELETLYADRLDAGEGVFRVRFHVLPPELQHK